MGSREAQPPRSLMHGRLRRPRPPAAPRALTPAACSSPTVLHTRHPRRHSRLTIKGDGDFGTENQNVVGGEAGKDAPGRCTRPPEFAQCTTRPTVGAVREPSGPHAPVTVAVQGGLPDRPADQTALDARCAPGTERGSSLHRKTPSLLSCTPPCPPSPRPAPRGTPAHTWSWGARAAWQGLVLRGEGADIRCPCSASGLTSSSRLPRRQPASHGSESRARLRSRVPAGTTRWAGGRGGVWRGERGRRPRPQALSVPKPAIRETRGGQPGPPGHQARPRPAPEWWPKGMATAAALKVARGYQSLLRTRRQARGGLPSPGEGGDPGLSPFGGRGTEAGPGLAHLPTWSGPRGRAGGGEKLQGVCRL